MAECSEGREDFRDRLERIKIIRNKRGGGGCFIAYVSELTEPYFSLQPVSGSVRKDEFHKNLWNDLNQSVK